MTKDEVLAIFEAAFADPGSIDGQYFYERLLDGARLIIKTNRLDLIEIFNDWISRKSEPHTSMAVMISGDINLWELSQPLKELREDVITGKAFLPYYVFWIDQALGRLRIEN
jgi:hypothetical protein